MKDLTAAQLIVLEALATSDLAPQYYLSGGTALSAFHLHHRLSDDLDFFTSGTVDSAAILRFITPLADGPLVPRRNEGRLGFIVPIGNDTVRVEFVRYDHAPIEAPRPMLGALRVDGVRDILANKLSAIVDRTESKDFADIYFLVARAGLSLEEGIADAQRKFGWPAFEILLQTALLKLENMSAWPELDPPVAVDEARRQFRAWAKTLIRLDEDE